jgi:hypothetical protein
MSTSRAIHVETGLFISLDGAGSKKNVNYRGFMYDTVQTATDLAVRIKPSV